MTASTDQFSQLLSQAVAGYAARTGMKKRVIAERCGYSPSMLSHLLSGKRRPGSRQAVLALSRSLELSRADANRLLTALDYSPLSGAEIGAVVLERRVAQVSVDELPQPDRDLLSAVMNNDLRLLSAAWRQYVDVREEARHGNWSQVTARAEDARDLQRQLVTIAPRFAAWLELSEAQSQRYQGRFEEAKMACRRGLAAAELAASPPIQSRLLVRLADIEKLLGNFAGASEHYAEARQAIARWSPASDTERQFADYWDARMKRELGNLYLFMAQPREAYSLLTESHDYFEAEADKYQQAHACHSLGWAAHLLGDWDASLEWRKRGIALGRELDAERGGRDELNALQDDLYMGLALVDRGEHQQAEEHLQRSLSGPQGKQIGEYHEAGLAHLALSRIYRANWEKRDLALAQSHASQGLEFYARMPVKDPVRMAIAHNTHGDLMMDLGRIPEARLDFDQALQWSLSSNPPNRYYEAKARMRKAGVHLTVEAEQRRPGRNIQLHMAFEGRPTDAGRVAREAPIAPAPEPLMAIAAEELSTAEDICQGYGYFPLLTQVKLLKAKLAALEGSAGACASSCWQGIEAALQTNRFVLKDAWARVEQLGQDQADLIGEIRSRFRRAIADPDSAWDSSLLEAMQSLCLPGEDAYESPARAS